MQDIMGSMDIAFPNIGLYLRNVPKSFDVFGFTIALYGVIIGFGVLFGVLIAARIAKAENLNPDIIWDFSIYAIIFSIIGARLYYVAFSWDMYKDDLLSILNTRKGGLAIYGAVLAAFLTLFIYCKVKNLSFLKIADICVPGLVFGQALGRYGNFTNREVFGEYTNSLFAMRLPIESVRASDISESIAAHIAEGTNYIQVHPTFLYESLWNLALLGIMLVYRRHKKFDGEQWLLYLGGYGLGRAWIEGIRTDTLFIPHTTIAVSQVLAIVLFVVAVVADIVIRFVIRGRQVTTPVVTIASTENSSSGQKTDGE